jgi:PBP1b-binding outer membrane lipoprotein LpoB
MRSYLFVLCLALFLAACGSGTPNTNNTVNNVNTRPPSGNKDNPLAVTTPTPATTTNNAPTLTPVYQAYCDAMVKKDEAALRRIFSSDTVRAIDSTIKQDAIKPPTLVKYFEDEQVTNDLCEVRNEQISGNEAVAEVRTKGTPNGILLIFVKEGAEWKLTNRSPTLKK